MLAIETSNPGLGGPAGVAIGRIGTGGVEPIDVEPIAAATRHSDDLVGAIERVCARVGVGAADVARIAVSIGPGGYTSLRIAATVAKMIALAGGAEVVAVPSAEVARASVADGALPALLLLACKRDGAWGALAPKSGPLEPLGVVRCDVLATLGVASLVADAHLPRSFAGEAARLGIGVVAPVLTPTACLRLGASCTPIDPAALAPIYAREPDAVTQWRGRKA